MSDYNRNMMDGDQKFWITIWFLIIVGVAALIYAATLATMEGRRLQQEFRTTCISKGNQYVAGNCVWSVR